MGMGGHPPHDACRDIQVEAIRPRMRHWDARVSNRGIPGKPVSSGGDSGPGQKDGDGLLGRLGRSEGSSQDRQLPGVSLGIPGGRLRAWLIGH